MTLETAAPVEDLEDPFVTLPPVTYSRIHVLAAAPVASFDGQTYPSLDLGEHGEPGNYSDVCFTVTGTRLQRLAFADQLRAVADAIANWQPSDPARSGAHPPFRGAPDAP